MAPPFYLALVRSQLNCGFTRAFLLGLTEVMRVGHEALEYAAQPFNNLEEDGAQALSPEDSS